MPPKGLQHKRELARRKKGKRGTVQQLKSKTARKKGGEIFTIRSSRAGKTTGKRGPGKGAFERELDRVRKENARKGDDDKLREMLRGRVGEVVASVSKPGEIVMYVRNAEGGLDRKVRTRTDA